MSASGELPGLRMEFQVTKDAALRRRRTIVKAQPVTTVRVNPEVWALALEQADGDARRIEMISATEVKIHNKPIR